MCHFVFFFNFVFTSFSVLLGFCDIFIFILNVKKFDAPFDICG